MVETNDTPEEIDALLEQAKRSLRSFEDGVNYQRLLLRLRTASPTHPVLLMRFSFGALAVLFVMAGVVLMSVPLINQDVARTMVKFESVVPYVPDGVPALPAVFGVLAACMVVGWAMSTGAALAFGRDAQLLPWEQRRHQQLVNEVTRLTTQRAVLERIRNTPVSTRPRIATPVSLSMRSRGPSAGSYASSTPGYSGGYTAGYSGGFTRTPTPAYGARSTHAPSASPAPAGGSHGGGGFGRAFGSAPAPRGTPAPSLRRTPQRQASPPPVPRPRAEPEHDAWAQSSDHTPRYGAAIPFVGASRTPRQAPAQPAPPPRMPVAPPPSPYATPPQAPPQPPPAASVTHEALGAQTSGVRRPPAAPPPSRGYLNAPIATPYQAVEVDDSHDSLFMTDPELLAEASWDADPDISLPEAYPEPVHEDATLIEKDGLIFADTDHAPRGGGFGGVRLGAEPSVPLVPDPEPEPVLPPPPPPPPTPARVPITAEVSIDDVDVSSIPAGHTPSFAPRLEPPAPRVEPQLARLQPSGAIEDDYASAPTRGAGTPMDGESAPRRRPVPVDQHGILARARTGAHVSRQTPYGSAGRIRPASPPVTATERPNPAPPAPEAARREAPPASAPTAVPPPKVQRVVAAGPPQDNTPPPVQSLASSSALPVVPENTMDYDDDSEDGPTVLADMPHAPRPRVPAWGSIPDRWLREALTKSEQLVRNFPVNAHIGYSKEPNLPFTLVIDGATPANAVRAMVNFVEFLAGIYTPPRARIELIDVAHLDKNFHRSVEAALEPYFSNNVFVDARDGRIDIQFTDPDPGWGEYPNLPMR